MEGCMDGWIDGWMAGWMDGDGWMDRWSKHFFRYLLKVFFSLPAVASVVNCSSGCCSAPWVVEGRTLWTSSG